ncbi:MAG: uroporphyrinogen-III synthase [Acidimicrobiales bacterium]
MNRRPLAGYTIGVTADRRSEEQIKLLSGRGAACLHGPVIKTHPVDAADALRDVTERLGHEPPAMVVLTTGVGVRGWLEAAAAFHLDAELDTVLDGAELLARGPKATGALVAAGHEVTWTTPRARYDDVIELLSDRGVAGARVAVQQDGAGALDLCRRIEALGAKVTRVPVYRWSLPDDMTAAEALVRAVVDGRVHGITFTARPAVENFLEIATMIDLGDQVAEGFRTDVAVFCVGPVCAGGLIDAGFDPPHVPERHRLGAMVQQISSYFAASGRECTLAGRPVRIQGNVAVIGDESVTLSEREQAVLDVLLERPGVVFSKAELLQRVWHGSETDRHLVEVTVARLRRRLGPAADGIETVVRRGYRAAP